MEQTVIYLLMVQKPISLKQKTEVVASPLCLGKISRDFSVGNMKKQD